MIKNSKQEDIFVVSEFMDKDGNNCGIEEAIIMTSTEDGVSLPFTKERLGNKVKIGDKFKVSTNYEGRHFCGPRLYGQRWNDYKGVK